MVHFDNFRTQALALPGALEQPHFDRAAFKVVNKRIFATLHEPSQTANVKLTPEDQSAFCEYNPEAIYSIPNKFGLQGWTTLELNKLSEEVVAEALYAAYSDVIRSKPKKK